MKFLCINWALKKVGEILWQPAVHRSRRGRPLDRWGVKAHPHSSVDQWCPTTAGTTYVFIHTVESAHHAPCQLYNKRQGTTISVHTYTTTTVTPGIDRQADTAGSWMVNTDRLHTNATYIHKYLHQGWIGSPMSIQAKGQPWPWISLSDEEQTSRQARLRTKVSTFPTSNYSTAKGLLHQKGSGGVGGDQQ